MPSFLIIGAARSGTTSLYHYLQQHPQIYMSPEKEPGYFALAGTNQRFQGPGRRVLDRPISRDLSAYRTLFNGAQGYGAIGEASTLYLYSPIAARAISASIPEAKLIAILRNPIERAYSHFLYLLQIGREPLVDFKQALTQEEARIKARWVPDHFYASYGMYHEQLSRYFEVFDESQIRIYLYEEFTSMPQEVLRDILHFLDVDETYRLNTSVDYNKSGLPRVKLLQTLLLKPNIIRSSVKHVLPRRLRKRLRQWYEKDQAISAAPPMTAEIRTVLAELYREGILKLQHLIKRDLSAWLE